MNCIVCNKSLIKWQKKYCSKSCSNRGRGREKLKCVNCNNFIQTGRKYCSHACQLDFQYKAYIDRWLQGLEKGGSINSISEYVRRYLLIIQQGKCSICKLDKWMGSPMPLIADHINGNPEDHTVENVRLVCGNCDMLLPTYKFKNKGNGRYYRTIRYQNGKS